MSRQRAGEFAEAISWNLLCECGEHTSGASRNNAGSFRKNNEVRDLPCSKRGCKAKGARRGAYRAGCEVIHLPKRAGVSNSKIYVKDRGKGAANCLLLSTGGTAVTFGQPRIGGATARVPRCINQTRY